MAVIEIITGDTEKTGNCVKIEYGGSPSELYEKHLGILKEAAEKGEEEINIAGAEAGENRSKLFQTATQGLMAAKWHGNNYELPAVIRFVCGSEEAANMYKTAYNYWIADDHDKRMEVPHHHD